MSQDTKQFQNVMLLEMAVKLAKVHEKNVWIAHGTTE